MPGGGGMGTLRFDSYIKRLMFKIVNGYTTTPPMKWPDRLETQATLFYSFLRSTKENATQKYLGCLWSDVRLLSSPGKRDWDFWLDVGVHTFLFQIITILNLWLIQVCHHARVVSYSLDFMRPRGGGGYSLYSDDRDDRRIF